MNATIIKFNRPLLIATDNVGDELIYQHYYGFVFDKRDLEHTLKYLDEYLAYLCLLSAVSNGDSNYRLYTKNDRRELMDEQGIIHSPIDDLMVEYGKECRQRLNLSYDILQRKIDEEALVKYTEDEYFITSEDFFCDAKV